MTVRIDALVNTAESAAGRIVSAAFELSGNAQLGQLDLNTPLGTTLARASWQPGNVAVSTPQGAATYPDLNAMTRALLGEELPLAALFDWLRGRPWPGAPVAAGSSSAEFAQLGWDVSLTQFSQGWVNARRAATNANANTNQPGVTVRVKLDAP